MTLQEFIKEGKSHKVLRAHLKVPGFKVAYFRFRNEGFLDDNSKVGPILDIASIEARTPGKGFFRKLIKKIRKDHPEMHIKVESVMTPEFRSGLRRMGFRMLQDTCEDTMAPNFFLAAKEPSAKA